MKVNPLNDHYSMNNPASVYDEEALTALELAGRTAQKVNECVTTVNVAYKHFVDNFAENVENSVHELADDGTLETMLVGAVSSGKVDKHGIGQVTYDMLAQDVREKFTDGAVPVVGAEAVSTANIVDGSIIESKLTGNLKNVWYFPISIQAMHTPLIKLSSADYSATINPDYTFTGCKLICRDTLYALDPNNMNVDASMWTTGMASIYYDPATQVFYVANVTTTNATTKRCLYLGSMGGDASEFIIPVDYNGGLFVTGSKKMFRQLPLTTMRVEVYEVFPYHQSSALFNFDWNTGVVTFTQPTKIVNFPVETLIFSCDFSKVTAEVVGHSANNGHLCVYFNPFKQKFIFSPTNTTAWRTVDDCLYLGKITPPITADMELIGKNSCILPHTINNTHYVHPKIKERPIGKLIIDNNYIGFNSVPLKIDYEGRKAIIPSGSRTFIMGNGYYAGVLGGDGKYIALTSDYEIPFVSGDNQYLVGSTTGLKFITPTEYKTAYGKHDINGLWDLGYLNVRGKTAHLHCDTRRAIKFSILGDSVSTFTGMIPSGNAVYYTGSNCGITSYKQTWWGRVADTLGWKLCVNNSWSGSMVTDKTAKGSVHRASLLHTADESPDVIFFAMGGNDFNQGVNMGTLHSNEGEAVNCYRNNSADFYSSYITTLYTLKKNYPNAKIYAFTFFPSLRYKSGGNTITSDSALGTQFPPENLNGTNIMELNNYIRKACDVCGIEIIDLWTAGYSFDNAHLYFGDFISDKSASNYGYHLHQNAEGMKLWANKVISQVKNFGEVF